MLDKVLLKTKDILYRYCFSMESCCMEDEDVLTSQEYQKVSCSAEVLVKHQTSMDLEPFEIYRGFKNILKL